MHELLSRLRDFGLKIAPGKVQYQAEEIEFLGHIITKEGFQIPQKRLESLLKVLREDAIKDLKSLRRALGMAGFVRKFIRNYATYTRPLDKCVARLEADKTLKLQDVFTDECRQGLHGLFKALQEAPTLLHPDPKKRFFLFVDASKTGVGTMVAQYDDPAIKVAPPQIPGQSGGIPI